jgi:endoglucanase
MAHRGASLRHGVRPQVRYAGLIAGVALVAGLMSACIPTKSPQPNPTFSVTPTSADVGAAVSVESITPCPAGTNHVDIQINELGVTPGYQAVMPVGNVNSTTGAWSDPNDSFFLQRRSAAQPGAQPGNAQFQAWCFPTSADSNPSLTYAPVDFTITCSQPGPAAASITPPLYACGRYIVDSTSARIKLATVNWYGAEEQDFVPAGLDRQSVTTIAQEIRDRGFNSVRLPWSNYLLENNPPPCRPGQPNPHPPLPSQGNPSPPPDPATACVPQDLLAANGNEGLRGQSALDVFTGVVKALEAKGLLIILDNHSTDPIWCCSLGDNNGLWYAGPYTGAKNQQWINDWTTMAQTFAGDALVVGADLRNEPRDNKFTDTHVYWGNTPEAGEDWHAAAQAGADAIKQVNPSLLIMVEGVNLALDLGNQNGRGGVDTPCGQGSICTVSAPSKLVYSAHDYQFDHANLATYPSLHDDLGNNWGYLITQGQPYTAPVWVGEFGTCHDATNNNTKCLASDNTSDPGGFWFKRLTEYLCQGDYDFSYWALNGTEAAGYDTNPDSSLKAVRTVDTVESYGLLDQTWTTDANPALTQALQELRTPNPTCPPPPSP